MLLSYDIYKGKLNINTDAFELCMKEALCSYMGQKTNLPGNF